jgi:hypothetical protein
MVWYGELILPYLSFKSDYNLIKNVSLSSIPDKIKFSNNIIEFSKQHSTFHSFAKIT